METIEDFRNLKADVYSAPYFDANNVELAYKAGFDAAMELQLIAKVADWAFREGWKERARMTGVSKKNLDEQFYERIRIMLGNKLYKKAFDNPYLGVVREKFTKNKTNG